MAIPAGAALGYGIGATVGSAVSWNAAFFVCGIPGFVAAFLVLKINNPAKGINDTSHSSCPNPRSDSEILKARGFDDINDKVSSRKSHSSFDYENKISALKNGIRSFRIDASEILCNRYYLCALAGYAATNFSLGGLADWFASFMVRYTDSTVTVAGKSVEFIYICICMYIYLYIHIYLVRVICIICIVYKSVYI